MGGRILQDDETRQAHDRYIADENASIRDIAEGIPVHERTLAAAFKRLGLPAKTKGRPKRDLSETDRRVHGYLVEYMTANDGVPPPVREISRELGYSTTSVISASLIFLRDHGLIRIVDGERNIRLVGGRYIYDGERIIE